MIISPPLSYLFLILVAINLFAFILILLDKFKSTSSNSQRISEGKLFFMAAAFGALGVYLGMFVCRHKTRKWYFLLGIPLLIVQNITCFYILYLLLTPAGLNLDFIF